MGKSIELTAPDGHRFQAYRADPAGKPRGGLVIGQEIFGVNEHIRSVADRFAQAGYLAIAPGLFDRVEPNVQLGYTGEDANRGKTIKQQLTLDNALKDVQAAIAVAAEAGKVGIVGYCWGGTLAWASAARLDGLSVAVAYYGGEIATVLLNEKPRIPTLAHFGELDSNIPQTDVEKIRAAHPQVPVHVYPGAGHGFNCSMRGSYHEASANLALERTLAFLNEHMG